MTDVLNVVDEPRSEIGNQIQAMIDQFMPTPIPNATSLGLGTISTMGDESGSGPSDTMQAAILNNIASQGSTGDVPFAAQMNEDFSTLIDQMAYVDTSVVSTEEALNDMIMENPIAATPWDDGSDKSIQQYDPLFVYRTDRKATSPGFHTLATPVIINQIQARLLQTEREAAIFGLSNVTSRPRGRPAPTHALAVDKRIRLIEARTPHDRVRPGTQQQVVDSTRLDVLRYYGADTPEGLYEKLYYLGPVTQVQDWGSGSATATGSTHNFTGRVLTSERIINYSYHSRGKIANLFGTNLERGDNLYFTIAKYARDQLLQFGVASGTVLGKRANADAGENPQSSYVGAVQRAASADEVVQIRGWSSREGREWLGDTSPMEGMQPDVADRWYVDRVVLAATQYTEFRYNEATDEIVPRNLIAEEGVQEAIANLPDIVIENYLAPGVIIPVGTVKQRLTRQTTPVAILNAHYDARLLALQPHVEIYQNA